MRRGFMRPRRLGLGTWVAVVVCIAPVYVGGLLAVRPHGSVQLTHVFLALAVGVVAGLAQLRLRVGSHVLAFEWGETAVLLQIALLPAGQVPIAAAAGFCLANVIDGRRQPLKALYNAAMWLLSASTAVTVFGVVAGHGPLFGVGGLVGLALAALTFGAVTQLLTGVVVSIAEKKSVRRVLSQGAGLSVLICAGNVAAALLILALARWSPWSLFLLPPMLLGSHVAFRGTARARRDRDAWRGLAEATQPIVGDVEAEIFAAAAERAVVLFDAHHIELQRTVAGELEPGWLAVAPAGITTSDAAPEHFVEVPLHDGGGVGGALRLCFTANVLLSTEERQSLQTFAHWLAGTLEQARLMAASVEVAGQMRDLADRKAHEAAHDALTGLANRSTLLDRGAQSLATADARTDVIALLLVDLDHFKEVNDTLGHGAGDILLRIVAGRLSGCAGQNALVARLGGDEFAVLITGLTHTDDAETTARRFAQELGLPAEVDSYRLAVEGSVGIACFPEDGDSMSELLRRADVALYQAKSSPAGVARYDQRRDATSIDRLSLLPDLQTALSEGHIRLHYQPKYDLQSGLPLGAEALARWFHPVQGVLPPDLWIPAVEQSSLMREFTAYVLDQAIGECVSWPIDRHTVAVNLSARSLLDGELPSTVASLLKRHGLPAERLVLEITETVMMSSLETVEQTLTALRKLGVKLSVDDFGTGYSSLTFLARQTVDEVKLDRSFVAAMTHSEESAAIVRSVIDLAHALKLDVVAEGVETSEQEHRLRELGCNIAQGFRFSKPVPASKIAELLLGSRCPALHATDTAPASPRQRTQSKLSSPLSAFASCGRNTAAKPGASSRKPMCPPGAVPTDVPRWLASHSAASTKNGAVCWPLSTATGTVTCAS